MDRIIDTIEAIAALFVGLVAADIFISVILRRFFSTQIPDAYDFGSMLLGILIFWGIAATSYRGGHITVDLVWAQVWFVLVALGLLRSARDRVGALRPSRGHRGRAGAAPGPGAAARG